MTLPREVLTAIGRAVYTAGGDMSDVEDLVRTWERLNADPRGRADRMRHEARAARCCCGDGGAEPTSDGRCSRCFGALPGCAGEPVGGGR
jgi:hypothetical protein